MNKEIDYLNSTHITYSDSSVIIEDDLDADIFNNNENTEENEIDKMVEKMVVYFYDFYQSIVNMF